MLALSSALEYSLIAYLHALKTILEDSSSNQSQYKAAFLSETAAKELVQF
jgi:hypothetical protein